MKKVQYSVLKISKLSSDSTKYMKTWLFHWDFFWILHNNTFSALAEKVCLVLTDSFKLWIEAQ